MTQKNIRHWTLGGFAVFLLAASVLVWRGYSRTFDITWDEEVQLHDGTVVVISRGLTYERLGHWAKYEPSIPRESRLRFVPAGDSQVHEVQFPHLRVTVFDVYKTVNYLVLTDTSGVGSMPDRSPFPIGEGQGNYRVLRWTGDRFVVIPLNELPAAIVDANLVWNDKATNLLRFNGGLLSLSEKALLNSKSAPFLNDHTKRIVRNSSEPASTRK